METSKMYFSFSEFNGWEKETWYWFFPMNPENFTCMMILLDIRRAWMKNIDEEEKEALREGMKHMSGWGRTRPPVAFSRYRVGYKLFTREEAEKQVEASNKRNGYLNSQIIDGYLKENKLEKYLSMIHKGNIPTDKDELYKGGILGFVYKRKKC